MANGKIVTFVSAALGQTSVTSNLATIALIAGISYDLKVLTMDTQLTFSRLEKLMLQKDFVETEMKKAGSLNIDAFLREQAYNSEIKISDFSLNIVQGKIDLLPSTRNKHGEIFVNKITDEVEKLLLNARTWYDITFIDMHNFARDYQQTILEKSDLIIVNINQNIDVLEKTFNNEILNKYQDKLIYIIGNYISDSNYNVRNIKRRFGIRNKIFSLPNNVAFMDASNDGKVVDYFIKNINAKNGDRNYQFISQGQKVIKSILKNTNLEESELIYRKAGGY